MELIKGITLINETSSLTTLGWCTLFAAVIILDIIGFKLLRLKKRLSLIAFAAVIVLIISSVSGKISVPYLTETIYRVKIDGKTTMKELSEKYEILRTENGEYVIKLKTTHEKE